MKPNSIALSAPLTVSAVASATGISEHTLRAWERRYGVPAPTRSRGRYRLYTPADVGLVESMRRHIAKGVKPAIAARQALAERDRCPANFDLTVIREELLAALLDENEAAAGGLLGAAVAAVNPCELVADLITPVLHEIGRRWEDGEIGVDVEHFASGVLRSRLETLTTQAEPPAGRLALLTCAPGERHELPLICLRLHLANHGWRSHVLGCDLPACNLADAAKRLRPALVAISVTSADLMDEAVQAAAGVHEVAPECAVVIGGQGVETAGLPSWLGGEAKFWELVEAPSGPA